VPLQGRDPQCAVDVADQARSLIRAYERSGNPELLASAVDILRRVVAGTRSDHPEHAAFLSNLGIALCDRYDLLGEHRDLDEALDLLRQAADTTPVDDPDRAMYLSNWGKALCSRHTQTGEPDDLDRAIALFLDAVNTARADDPHGATYLANLALATRLRFEETGERIDIETAVTAGRGAVDIVAVDDPARVGYLSIAGNALAARYDHLGQPSDIDLAIEFFRHAFNAAPTGHPARTDYLMNLGNALRIRYERGGQPRDIDLAIELFRHAFNAAPTGHPACTDYLSNLGTALCIRYERVGDRRDLDQAVETLRAAIDAAPAGHGAREVMLSTLGSALGLRYQRTGHRSDLDEAINLFFEACASVPSSQLTPAIGLSNLGNALRIRFERDGRVGDLDRAVDFFGQAVSATPVSNPSVAGYLSNYGLALRSRYDMTGLQTDLDAAIDASRRAVATAPIGHINRARYQINLGIALRSRFERTGLEDDLDEAVHAGREAIKASSADHPDHAMYLSNLANTLHTRYKLTEQEDDLHAVVSFLQQAVDTAPSDHPVRAAVLLNLGNALQDRYERFRRRDDLIAVLKCYRESAETATAPFGVRLAAAQSWGRRAFETGHLETAVDGFAVAVGLLPQVAWHGLDRATREDQLSRWSGLAADAAACAVAAGKPHRAVELLEHGRSVLWSQALHIRSDLSRLTEADPELAARLNQSRQILDQPLSDAIPTWENLASARTENVVSIRTAQEQAFERRTRAARQWDDALAEVRQLEGFEHFLAPTPFEELRQAATDGPVVIVNVSSLGCHALAIAVSDPAVHVIALPDLTAAAAIDLVNSLLSVQDRASRPGQPNLQRKRDCNEVFDILGSLWDRVTGPVLDALGYNGQPDESEAWPRIWWCPTGPLTMLPLHAAGHHPRSSSAPDPRAPSGATVSGRVISSYIPNLGALLRARRPPTPVPIRQLAIGMSTTPGHSPLPAVPEELKVVASYFPAPECGCRLVDEQAIRENVLSAIAGHPWIHLACHGGQHPTDPSLSAFALHDGPLTVAELARLELEHAELAFLSACQTATGHIHLLDEALHLAAAMQLVGYRHVIATLWNIADLTAPDVARDVYHELTASGSTDPDQAARALHNAIASLQSHFPNEPLRWAPYIHTGP